MTTVVLGAGAVGTATAWYLRKAGHDVTVIERQPEAALETSWGNGCVIHASEVEPWSQPGMPAKIVKWLGKENAPLLLRYGAIPAMWRWGIDFARNCTPEKFRANALSNLELALHSLKSLHEIGSETGISYDRATRGVLKIYRSPESLDGAQRQADDLARHGLLYERLDVQRCVEIEPALQDTKSTLAGALYFARDEVGDCNKFTQGLAAASAAAGVTWRYGETVKGIETSGGKVTGVIYFDKSKKEVVQRAKAVVVCANGAETPRLLLMSKSNQFPDGLANSSGIVGKHFMFNGGALSNAVFEHEVNGHRGPVVTRISQEFYELDEKLGLVGGGGFDFRVDVPAMLRTLSMPPDYPTWGSAFKKEMRPWFSHSLLSYAHTTSMPVETNSVSLDPELKDAWGLPAIRTTFKEHEQDMRLYKHFQERNHELLTAAGAQKIFPNPIGDEPGSTVHLLGTARMGNDPKSSVVDKFHRAHDVKNLFIVDGSSFVTSGRGQPTLTIQALAFRAADHIAQFAKRGEI